MNDPNIIRTNDGRRIATDGGTATVTGNGIAPGGASVDPAENMDGGIGFEAAVAHSQLRLAVEQHGADSKQAKKAAKNAMAFKTHRKLGGNSQLRKDEWERFRDAVVETAKDKLTIVDDLVNRYGLDVPLDLGVLRFAWEDIDEFSGADVDMAGETGGDEDSLVFTENGVPLPLIHKSYYINRRKLRASRNGMGQPISTRYARAATRVVSEKAEDLFISGSSSIQVNGETIDGLTNHADRNTVSGNATWDGASSDNMIDDVMRTIEAVEDANFDPGETGFAMYIARQNYQEARAKSSGTDDKAGVLEHLRNRMETEDDMPEVTFRRADRLSEGNAVLLKPSPEVVEVPMASDFQTLEWESGGGMTVHNKVLTSIIPALKSDANGNMGVAHLSGI